MNHAVALVQSYLRINGYFTVTEYPVVEAISQGRHRVATDIDVLACRFPGSGRLVPRQGAGQEYDIEIATPDPALHIAEDEADLIIGEVKEGEAHLNRSATEPAVLRSALMRFGGCPREESHAMVDELIAKGSTNRDCGGRVRLFAFGSAYPESTPSRQYSIILLDHIIRFLTDYIDEHWDILRAAQFSDPALGFLMTMAKSRQS